MANKKVSQLVSKPSVLVTDLFPIADPTTGQLYKTTISDLGTAIGSGVSSVNTLVGAVVLDTDDIQELASPTNRWFTDTRARAAVSASSPLAYNNGTGVFSIPQATGSQNGFLSSADWTTFNAKQQALSGTGFVKISGTTISYDNSTYLTTSAAASTYLALAGGTLTGALNGTSATFTGDLTISSANPRLYFTDTDNNPDYFISNTDGTFTIYDVTNSVSRFTLSGSTGTFGGNLTVGQIIRSGGSSSEFLKADGSVDSTAYLSLAGGTMTGQIVLKEASSSTDYTKGLRFPNDPFTGSGDISGLRLYSSSGENQILELYIGNDGGLGFDNINFATGVGGTANNDSVTINGNKIWNAGNLTPQTQLNGTGFVKASGTTITYDNTSYLPLSGGTLTGSLIGTSANFNLGGTSNSTNAGFFTINDGSNTLGGSFATVNRNANDGNGRFSLSRWQVQNTSGLSQSAFIGAQAVTGASNYNPNLILGVSNGVSSYTTYLTLESNGAANFSNSINAPSGINAVGQQRAFSWQRTSGTVSDVYSLNADSGSAYLQNDTTTNVLMTWLEGGNIGIGNSSPSDFIDATLGLAIIAPSGRSGLTLGSTQGTANEVLGRLSFTNTNSTNAGGKRLAFISGIRGTTNNSAYLEFGVANDGLGSSVMTLNQGGYLTVGGLRLKGSDTANTIYNASSNMAITCEAGYNISIGRSSDVTNSLNVNTTNGNVLIGTTTDYGYKLAVAGNGFFRGGNARVVANNIAGASNIHSFLIQRNDSLIGALGIDNSDRLAIFNSSASVVGYFNQSTGAYVATSDFNKKKDFEESTFGLNAILGLKPTLFRMKSESNSDKHLGFIAQEVLPFIPQAYQDNGDFIGLDYQPIIATLVKAIQEQQAQIEELKNI